VRQQLVEINAALAPAQTGRVAMRANVPHIVTTQAFDWPGMRLEAGSNNIASVDDVAGIHHYISMNLDDRPLTLEVKGQNGFRRVVLRRGSAWVNPPVISFPSASIARSATYECQLTLLSSIAS